MESDVQESSKETKEIEIDEQCPDEHQPSKIPRTSKTIGSPKRKLSKEGERPQSAKTKVALENKYRASAAKYNKELKDFLLQNDKLQDMRENMIQLKEELSQKGMSDLSSLPEIPPSVKLPPEKARRLSGMAVNSAMVGGDELMRTKHQADEEILHFISAEMPNIERSLKGLSSALQAAHEKQDSLESNLNIYKENIATIMNDFENIENIKKNTELLIRELENAKEEFKNERDSFRKEIKYREEELSRLRCQLEAETSKRQCLEYDYSEIMRERDQISEDYKELEQLLEKRKNNLPGTLPGEKQDLAILNGQLNIDVDDLRVKLQQAERKLASLSEESVKNKMEIHKLIVEKEEIKTEFINHCAQSLFEKENQIYSIKCKMDSIVNLKNTMVSREGRGEPYFNIDLVMNINDSNALKKEVVSLHKKLIGFEENRSDLERKLSNKEVKLTGLEDELVVKTQELLRMEYLIDMMKNREKENARILASIDLSTEALDQQLDSEIEVEGKEKVWELVSWYEKQKGLVAEMEKELRTSEERYSLSEERRIRNEERIANLQLKLAKYQYFR